MVYLKLHQNPSHHSEEDLNTLSQASCGILFSAQMGLNLGAQIKVVVATNLPELPPTGDLHSPAECNSDRFVFRSHPKFPRADYFDFLPQKAAKCWDYKSNCGRRERIFCCCGSRPLRNPPPDLTRIGSVRIIGAKRGKSICDWTSERRGGSLQKPRFARTQTYRNRRALSGRVTARVSCGQRPLRKDRLSDDSVACSICTVTFGPKDSDTCRAPPLARTSCLVPLVKSRWHPRCQSAWHKAAQFSIIKVYFVVPHMITELDNGLWHLCSHFIRKNSRHSAALSCVASHICIGSTPGTWSAASPDSPAAVGPLNSAPSVAQHRRTGSQVSTILGMRRIQDSVRDSGESLCLANQIQICICKLGTGRIIRSPVYNSLPSPFDVTVLLAGVHYTGGITMDWKSKDLLHKDIKSGLVCHPFICKEIPYFLFYQFAEWLQFVRTLCNEKSIRSFCSITPKCPDWGHGRKLILNSKAGLS
ncbi:hypothetical protein XELAEV_18043377mg [Xenopus laevis]|uniref:Uncharacterized protein n=1 Tax=Xenopus laevis TaxID=8355 RepID=A0A974BWH9_XENLA|nr:hypothetical protein XELAEV_18043377mg [Xenopus laevis]